MGPAGRHMSASREHLAPVRDRAAVATSIILLLIAAVAWVDVIRSSLGTPDMMMTMFMPMTMADGLAFVASWAVMMTAMMLPSATPLVVLYGVAARSQGTAGRQTWALVAGYLLVWMAFSLGATALQRVLASLLLISPMMAIISSPVAATLLFIAGVYQLTPVKQACLRACQSPLGFLTSRWRAGASGAFTIGLEHGVYCVGCCWAMMLLLFAGGVMNLTVIAALTAFVAFERLAPFGLYGARVSGVLLMGVGVWMLAR